MLSLTPTLTKIMSRPVTLFTGQWADLPLEKLAPLAAEMGYDGLELACWGDHFDVAQANSKKKSQETTLVIPS
jgi:sugar phosphate isomerase/epimerase